MDAKNLENESRLAIIDPGFVDECAYAGSLGAGILAAYILQDQLRINMTTNETLKWAGHHFQLDIKGEGKALIENVSLEYLERANMLKEEIGNAAQAGNKDELKNLEKKRDHLKKMALSLRSRTGRDACLEFMATNPVLPLAITSDEMDQDPMLFAVENGVLDLRIGELRDGQPKDKILKASPVKWEGIEAPCPVWEKSLYECFEDPEKIAFLQRWSGYLLTGDTSEQKSVMMAGGGGNGKSEYAECMLKVMGDYAAPIQAEMLMDPGRGRTASGPSPDIMSLMGLRSAFASESDEGQKISPSRFKWFTGGDTLVGRRPHDKHMVRFQPTHKLTLLTNNEPAAPAHDYAFWRRVLTLTWPFSFTSKPSKKHEKKKDDRLREKLDQELPGILAWCVRGLVYWMRDGLQPPASVVAATEDYRRSEDIIQDFIDESCITTTDPDNEHQMSVNATELYQAFSDWFQKYHSKRVPSRTWFGRRMAKKYTRAKYGGQYRYYGILLMDQ